jgi:uncharacterized protein YkwD
MRIEAPARSICLSVLLAVAAVVAMTIGRAPNEAFALTNCTVSDLTFDSEEQAFLKLINDYRAAQKPALGALTVSVNLNRAASFMSYSMATQNFFSHTDQYNRGSNTRMKQCGATVPGSGENIAAGTSWDTAAEAFAAWKASSGHNENMLRSTFKQIGIARYYSSTSKYKWYWTTDFSTANDGTNLLGSGGGGGGTTPTPVPDNSSGLSPAPGSKLAGSSVTFTWAAVSGAQEYYIYMGTSAGRNNLYSKSTGLTRSATISGLPTNGSNVYMRLWTRVSGVWQYKDYVYKAAG